VVAGIGEPQAFGIETGGVGSERVAAAGVVGFLGVPAVDVPVADVKAQAIGGDADAERAEGLGAALEELVIALDDLVGAAGAFDLLRRTLLAS